MHPQTKRLKLAIQPLKEDQTRRLGSQRKGCIRGVLVSRPLVARALALLDTLFQLLEEVGCAVTVAPWNERSGGFAVRYKEGVVDAQLIEEVKRRGQSASVHGWTYQLTGRLAFRIGGTDSPGGRRSWRDTRLRPLEKMLDDIVAGVLLAGRLQDQRIQRRKEWQQQWEQERSRQEEAARLQAEELAWQNEMQNLCDEWLRYERVRSFISACEARFAQRAPGKVDEGAAAEWLARAKAHAEGINPLAGNFLDRFARTPAV